MIPIPTTTSHNILHYTIVNQITTVIYSMVRIGRVVGVCIITWYGLAICVNRLNKTVPRMVLNLRKDNIINVIRSGMYVNSCSHGEQGLIRIIPPRYIVDYFVYSVRLAL